jgi:hypothetical protein
MVLLACGASPSRSSTLTGPASGITGRVIRGPTCPVQRAGQACVQPYAATIGIYTATGSRLVKTFRSARDGAFRVPVGAGGYVLKATGTASPHLTPTTVRVRPGRFTRVTLLFDTGIR